MRMWWFLGGLMLFSQTVPADDIDIMYHERPPYYYTEASTHSAKGILVEPVKQALSDAGISHHWVQVPSQRQLLVIKTNQRPICAIGWFKTPQREQFAKFSQEIYQDNSIAIVTHQDWAEEISSLSLDSLLQSREVHRIARTGYSYGKYLDEKIRQFNPDTLFTTRDNQYLVRLIVRKRIHYMFMSQEEFADLQQRLGKDGEELALVHPDGMPKGNKRYILCSQKTDDEFLSLINQALVQQQHAR